MENSTFSLESLLIVTVLALLVPLIVSKIKVVRIPIVVGEILVGVIVGKSGFNIIQSSQWLQFLQFFGLAYLMFVSGLELDFKTLLPKRRTQAQNSTSSEGARVTRGMFSLIRNPLAFALISCVLTFGLSIALSIYLHHLHLIRSPFLLALIITTTSLTIVVPVLKEYDLLDSEFGQLILAAAMFADFVTMLLISVAASLFQGGFSPKVLFVFILIFALLFMYRLFRRFSNYRSFKNLAHGTAQLGIRASMAIMIVFLVLAESLGVQVILGTFLAGVLVGLVNEETKSDIFHKLDAIGFGFLIPIFFIMVGVDFDFRSLFSDPKALILLPVLFIATYVFKGLPVLLLRSRYSWRDTLSGAALLTTQMSVTVAAAAVGMQIGAISRGVDTAIILVAMLTAIISPVVFGKLLPHRDHAVDRQVVIVGNLPGAKLLVDELSVKSQRFLWVQAWDQALLETGLSIEQPTKHHEDIGQGDQDIENCLPALAKMDIHPQGTKALVAYTSDDHLNIQLASAAVSLGVESVICSIRDLGLFEEHRQSAPFVVINSQFAEVALMDQLINHPVSTQLLRGPGDMQIQEVRLCSHAYHGKRLMEVEFPGNLLIMSIVRDGKPIVPHGHTELHVGDTVLVVGEREDITQFVQSGKRG
ncbi:cation:proton antiporter [Alicyclobacillus ferrooxydans]|uniref:RCK C-terminal domain-containing protein n=1 Tax=Alicyclobacillus ferrooxydans TaxID=471514 RepID=A0A0P9CB77_9BACL|nr:cation:proton antiporter [Alicyclobacillus ferrooxydans]KPV42735.1 hypothetical protein AN477_15365 [Alicyclobacillus ferrooxydans]